MAISDISGMTPKSGKSLKVLLICRVSSPGPGKQDIRSLDDQEQLLRESLANHYHDATLVAVIAGTGSGELLNRPELLASYDAIESGEYDLVLCEDLGRIMRRTEASRFCELAEDSETRVIALNDGVDTADDHWQMNALFASMRHEMYNADTAKRIRRSHRNRFQQGGVVMTVPYGYIKPAGTKSDADLQKDPDAEKVFDEWFRRLEVGQSFAAIADWLNEKGVPTGPSCRRKTWNGCLVGQVTRNPILKGVRERNRRMSRRINKTGQRKSVKAPPKDLLRRECPHLVFIDPERYDYVIAMLNERNDRYSRRHNGKPDARARISRKRTRFPGQCVYCGICGEMYVFGAMGKRPCLLCRGATGHTCWNGITLNSELAVDRIGDVVFEAIKNLAEFDEVFLHKLRHEMQSASGDVARQIDECQSALAQVEKQLANVMKLVRDGVDSDTLRADLSALESEKQQLTVKLQRLNRSNKKSLRLPTASEIKVMAQQSFANLARDNYDFGDKMRALVPRIVVFPYRLCDGGKPRLRARFRLSLASLCADRETGQQIDEALDLTFEVDVFDPPQRELVRREIATGRFAGLNQYEIADQLGLSQPAVSAGVVLQQRMDELGLSEAYVPLLQPPDDQTRMRRHKHKNYNFQKRSDAGQL